MINLKLYSGKDIEHGSVLIGISDGGVLTESAVELDRKTDGAITNALSASNFKGKSSEILVINGPRGTKYVKIILAGLGKTYEISQQELHNIGFNLFSKVKDLVTDLNIIFTLPAKDNYDLLYHFMKGFLLASYTFHNYKTLSKIDYPLTNVNVYSNLQEDLNEPLYDSILNIVRGVAFTKDLINEPANYLYPEEFAKRLKALEEGGLKVTIIPEKQLQKLKFNSLLCVGKGSAKESYVVVLEWMGNVSSKNIDIALVGKGVCFDSGGISLKPGAGMEEMKYDMAGAAVVSGVMKIIALSNTPVNIIGIVGLVENMPSGDASRPGDIVTSLSGQTIEILNTDAEGRLILCDLLTYTCQTYNPRTVIDLATLTGNVIQALGHEYAGLFSNNDELSGQLYQTGLDINEKLWRMPLHETFDQLLNSPIADMQNIGKENHSGSIVAAQFLQRFIPKNTSWAHLDIAGTSWKKSSISSQGESSGGPTGFGVQLLHEFILKYYSKK